jgi:hypothetical protein
MQEAWPERLIQAREHQWGQRAERSGLPARQEAPHIAGALAVPGLSHLTPTICLVPQGDPSTCTRLLVPIVSV